MQCAHTFFEIFVFSHLFLFHLCAFLHLFFCFVLFRKSPCARSAFTLYQYIAYINFVKIREISQKRYAVLPQCEPYFVSCLLNNSSISFEYLTRILIKNKERKNDHILHKFKRHCTMQKLFLFCVCIYLW